MPYFKDFLNPPKHVNISFKVGILGTNIYLFDILMAASAVMLYTELLFICLSFIVINYEFCSQCKILNFFLIFSYFAGHGYFIYLYYLFSYQLSAFHEHQLKIFSTNFPLSHSKVCNCCFNFFFS